MPSPPTCYFDSSPRAGRRACRGGRDPMCCAWTADVPTAMHQRPSTIVWLPSRGCSPSVRCAIPTRRTPSPRARRPDGPLRASAPGCSSTWRADGRNARCSACVSPSAFLSPSIAARSWPWCRACAASATGRWPGSWCSADCEPVRCSPFEVKDVDIGGRWLRVWGKGAKERRVPLDVDVAGLIQSYLLVERPETASPALFVVAKGPNRGQPLTPAGLRTIFRYHRSKAGVPAGHPHALRHTFATALAEAGVDLAVMQALLGHAHIDTVARYVHLTPVHVKKEFDAARERQRARR